MTQKNKAPYEFFATAGGLGYIKKAPGTFGSIPGLAVGYLIFKAAHQSQEFAPTMILLALTLLVLIAYFIINAYETHHKTHDDQRIVIDEVVGQAIAVCMLGTSWQSLAISFALFRLFDIFKPGPIGWVDKRMDNSWGTLLDDVLAGAVAGGFGLAISSALQMI